MLVRGLTYPFRWMFKKIVRFCLPIGLSFLVAYGIAIWNQEIVFEEPIEPIEFSVRKVGVGTGRSCLEIYESETYETFEALCRLKRD